MRDGLPAAVGQVPGVCYRKCRCWRRRRSPRSPTGWGALDRGTRITARGHARDPGGDGHAGLPRPHSRPGPGDHAATPLMFQQQLLEWTRTGSTSCCPGAGTTGSWGRRAAAAARRRRPHAARQRGRGAGRHHGHRHRQHRRDHRDPGTAHPLSRRDSTAGPLRDRDRPKKTDMRVPKVVGPSRSRCGLDGRLTGQRSVRVPAMWSTRSTTRWA